MLLILRQINYDNRGAGCGAEREKGEGENGKKNPEERMVLILCQSKRIIYKIEHSPGIARFRGAQGGGSV